MAYIVICYNIICTAQHQTILFRSCTYSSPPDRQHRPPRLACVTYPFEMRLWRIEVLHHNRTGAVLLPTCASNCVIIPFHTHTRDASANLRQPTTISFQFAWPLVDSAFSLLTAPPPAIRRFSSAEMLIVCDE